MRNFLTFAIGLLLVSSCQMEEPVIDSPESIPGTVEYVSVSLLFPGDSDTKSVLGPGCEEIQRIIAFAFDKDGNILTYGSNAGSLSGNKIVLMQTGTIDTWTLPTNTAMDLYVIANPSNSHYSASFTSSVNTKEDLKSAIFFCNKFNLSGMASGGLGIPKSGTLEVASGEISTDDCSLEIPLKNLFAKYSLSFDLSMLPQGCKVEPKCVQLYNSNTRLPYFAEDYCQSNSSYLEEFDYATAEDLAKLSSGKAVTIYAMENCHGLKTGAKSWKTVSKDLSGWSELPYCTKMLVDADVDGVTQSFVVYLGAGDMKSDFNVRRNVYKEIKLRLRPRNTDAYLFEFDQDLAPLTIMQGGSLRLQNLFGESLNSYISGDDYLDFRFLNDDESESGYFTILSEDSDRRNCNFEFSCTAATPLGDYWLEGGHFSGFSFDGTTHPAVRDRIRVKVVENISVDFTKASSDGDIYPFLPVTFESESEYTEDKATSIINGISFTSIDANIHKYEFSKLSTGTGYKVVLKMYPSAPGSVNTQKFTYNGIHKTIPAFSVLVPELKAVTAYPVSVSLDGNATSFLYQLVKTDGQTPLDYTGISGIQMTVNLENPSNVDFGKTLSAELGDPSKNRLTLSLKSFTNLPGFDQDNYSFNGYGFNICAILKFNGAGGLKYQKSLTIPGYISNPCPGWDGVTHTYRVDQGAAIDKDESYVTDSFNDGKAWKPEYLLEWPSRTFTVDLSRGGTRTGMNWSAYEIWTEYSAFPSNINSYKPNSSGKVSFLESLFCWGPLYYGKRLTNTQSGETRKFVHSIVRLYDHFNVFATLKVREDSHINKGSLFDSVPDGNPYYNVESWTYGNTGIGALKIMAAWINTMSAIGTTVVTFGASIFLSTLSIITGWTMALTDAQTGVLDVSLKHNFGSSNVAGKFTRFLSIYTPDQIKAFDGHVSVCKNESDNSLVEIIDVASIAGSCDDALCTLGYMPGGSSSLVYHIISDKVSIVRGLGGECVGVPNWRRLMAQNEPWYKVLKRNNVIDQSPYTSGKYIHYSAPVKITDGTYNISIAESYSTTSNPDRQKYLDDNNLGYHYMHLFWEGKKGKYSIKASHLNPRTDYGTELNSALGDFSVTLANGWYDPTPYYAKGLPIIGPKIGKYFFPESDNSDSRILAGSDGSYYYKDERPWKTNCWSTRMETDMTSANATDDRDINAYHKYIGGGQFE